MSDTHANKTKAVAAKKVFAVQEIKIIEEVHCFVGDYVFESGEGGLHIPNDFEKNLIADAIMQWIEKDNE